ncbi:MAG: hypothetical protein H6658_20555 [Ardenticatenaceae bacterium]|nr:hypothetical protein [Ardenticatenaceae bacterium]
MKQKSNNQKLHPAIGMLGGLTVLIGILFLADVMFGDWLGANLWPLRIIVPGVALFFGTLFMDEKIGVPLSIVSGVTTMTGLILMVHVLTDYWATWAYSWALLFPTAMGLGLLAYGVVKTRPDLRRAGWHLTKVGLALFMVFAVFFEFIIGLGGFSLAYGWPLLLISLGLFIFTLSGFDRKQYDHLLSKGTDKTAGF